MIKNINNLFFNFIKNELHNIIKKLKECNYFTSEHYILRLRTLINEFIEKDFNDEKNTIINSIFAEFKSNINIDNFYKNNEYIDTFYKYIFEDSNNLTFEERFFLILMLICVIDHLIRIIIVLI